MGQLTLEVKETGWPMGVVSWSGPLSLIRFAQPSVGRWALSPFGRARAIEEVTTTEPARIRTDTDARPTEEVGGCPFLSWALCLLFSIATAQGAQERRGTLTACLQLSSLLSGTHLTRPDRRRDGLETEVVGTPVSWALRTQPPHSD